VVAIGNAPTALFRLLELLDAGAPRPAAILGLPVGFVGAAESKEALAANQQRIPFLIVRGRMGGSAMTAAPSMRSRGPGYERDARLIGVGVGPGDPELLTLKATRALREADVVAHFAKAGNASRARAIAADHIRPDALELPLLYPVTTEIPQGAPAYCDKIAAFYDDSAAAVAAHLNARRSVAVICEGDPLFYAPICICMCGLRRTIEPK